MKSARQRVEKAYGQWLVKRPGCMVDYVSKIAKVPTTDVWDYLLGRKA